MIKTKFFSVFYPAEEIDQQINNFVTENQVQIVDVKLVVNHYPGAPLESVRALLIYKERHGEQ